VNRRDIESRLFDRYDQLDPDAPVPEPAEPSPAPVTGVHAEVVGVLHDLLGMVDAGSATGHAGLLIRALRMAEPMLLRDLARVDPAQLVGFLHDLGGRLCAVGAGTPLELSPELDTAAG